MTIFNVVWEVLKEHMIFKLQTAKVNLCVNIPPISMADHSISIQNRKQNHKKVCYVDKHFTNLY